MKKMITVVFVEAKKFFHSKVPLLTLSVLAIIPVMAGFFMFVLKDPNLAQNLGLISAKANLMGTADWPSYFSLLAQAIAIGGMIVFGFVTAWIFGREYSDRTINDLLALPKSRSVIVIAKFIVAVLWCMVLSLFVLVFGLIVGKIVDIPLWSVDVMTQGISVFIVCSVLTSLLTPPVALFASIGRGYLSALGFMIFTLVLAQIIAFIGYGQYFPWAIPPLIAGITGDDGVLISYLSINIVLLTSVLGTVGTLLWWRYADHS